MEIEFLFFLFTLLITGTFSGLIAGLLGIGGGIVVIPVIFYILNFYNFSREIIMHVAIASSIGVIFVTSFSSTLAHYKLNNIDFEIIKKWLVGIILGSIFGAIFASSIKTNILIMIFVIITTVVASSMFFNRNISISNKIPKSLFLNNIISFLIGSLSVLMGIGGGSFSVPTLSAFGKNIQIAVGTSACLGFFIALPGFITYVLSGIFVENLPRFSLGYVNLPIVLTVACASVLTAPIGAKISIKVKKSLLRKFFAFFLLLICISLVIDQYYLN